MFVLDSSPRKNFNISFRGEKPSTLVRREAIAKKPALHRMIRRSSQDPSSFFVCTLNTTLLNIIDLVFSTNLKILNTLISTSKSLMRCRLFTNNKKYNCQSNGRKVVIPQRNQGNESSDNRCDAVLVFLFLSIPSSLDTLTLTRNHYDIT